MIKAVFLDLDDTLCDSRAAWKIAVNVAFDRILRRHPSLSRLEVSEIWLPVNKQLLARVEAGEITMARARDQRFVDTLTILGAPDPQFASDINRLLGENLLAQLRVFPDITVLETLIGAGFVVGIITNGADDNHPDSQPSKLRHLGIGVGWPDGRITISDAVGFRKPDPAIFEAALDAAGVSADEAIYVGDRPDSDIAGANRAGLRAILLDRAGDVGELAGDQRPNAVIRGLNELTALVAEG